MERKLAPIFIFLILFSVDLFAQLELVSSEYDFGLLRRADDHWVDLEIVNKSAKAAHILRIDAPKNIEVRFTDKTVLPGKPEFIRLALSPESEGPFEYRLLLHTGDRPVPQAISLKGESTFAATTILPCPDFGNESTTRDNLFHVSVRNKSDIALEEAEIRIYREGRIMAKGLSDKNGELSLNLPYGRYYIVVENNGSTIDSAMYINAVNNHLLAFLDEEDLIPVEGVEIPELTQTRPELDLPRAEPAPVADEMSDVLPISEFKESNLVFLVDVSASMKQKGKMDLLKIAMVNLIDALRAVDRFTLITYSNETTTLIETGAMMDKEACIASIMALEPRGGTAGAKAIDHAGTAAVKHFLESGNNQIILATDGAFNEGVDKALKHASKYNRKRITLSVLGIKCGSFTTSQMQELVEAGGGRLVRIDSDSDAGNRLIEEIKTSARR